MPIDFEGELRGALRRESAPADFAKKLRARLPVDIPVWRRPVVWAIAAVLLLAALLPPSISEYQRRLRERGMEARRELMVALRITSAKLHQTRERIQRVRHSS
jgi:hypothetical protein